MKEIELSKQGKYKGQFIALVDDCDSDLAELRWSVKKDKRTSYAHRRAGGIRHDWLHIVVAKRMFCKESMVGLEVDHIDGNGLNNRRDNLRLTTHQQNTFNQRKPNGTISQYKGVTFDKQAHKYVAQIVIGGKHIKLGRFKTETEAARRYDEAAKFYHGDYAQTNFKGTESK